MKQKDKKYQKSGNHAINVQAENVNITGITYQEAKSSALDVFRSNYTKSSKEVTKIAEDRAYFLVDEYLTKLFENNEVNISTVENPDAQYDLFQAQSLYARIGKPYLLHILTDMLVAKAKAKHEESLLKIILSEAIGTIGKLTEAQLNSLSAIFLVRYLIHHKPSNLHGLLALFRKYIVPLFENFPVEITSSLHLQYTGCAKLGPGGIQHIENLLQLNYEGFFRAKLNTSQFQEIVSKIPKSKAVFTKVSENPDEYKLKMIDREDFFELCEREGISIDKTKELYKCTPLARPYEIKNYIINQIPETINVFEKWDESWVGSIDLTSVGIAIAQANLNQRFNVTYDLRHWLNI